MHFSNYQLFKLLDDGFLQYHDQTALLRFFGFLSRTNRVPEGALLYLPFMIRADLGDLVEQYAGWLQNTQGCRFSTIANCMPSPTEPETLP